ncbi:GNS1/SUR4 family-domain-containing protein [Phyllosticta citricarpa]|uniref:Elongation of fatty acids protein n=1 Tax=Phyllosticta citricarpa TaxID=55181 RepID=A0ABR1M7M8_9PEZI
MSGPQLHLQLPDRSLFKFPPDLAPPAVAPPPVDDTLLWRAPFAIDAHTYNKALSPAVPITIASIYAVTVTVLNAYNRSCGNKPWWISKTKVFYGFVLAHNILLALYSAITNLAMLGALWRITPGFQSAMSFQSGLVENVDAYCKMNGPRGLGDAAMFNATSNAWELKNPALHLAGNGEPDPTDVGRLWNEGLAFWGWLFYLSKFYEVLDTAIILAKGKRSSTLQTYHHAGAMLCMWAGIRFMSPPIWMFVYINSGIHALMYTYYTFAALGIRVPQRLKRTLTTMQIAQFLVGASFAMLHLFVAYTIPVSTPHTVIHKVTAAVESLASEASAAAVSAGSVAAAGANWAPTFKKILLRAVGEEGLAENVRDDAGSVLSGGAAARGVEVIEETKWKNEYVKVNCIDTTGQSFAIWLNVIYLMPLTMLFTRFFIRSYLKRNSSSSPPKQTQTLAAATSDAKRNVNNCVEGFGASIEKAEFAALPQQLQKDLKRLQFLIKDNAAPQLLVSNAVRDVERGILATKGSVKAAGERALTFLRDRARGLGVLGADEVESEEGGRSEVEEEEDHNNGWVNGNGNGNGHGLANGNGATTTTTYADMVKH